METINTQEVTEKSLNKVETADAQKLSEDYGIKSQELVNMVVSLCQKLGIQVKDILAKFGGEFAEFKKQLDLGIQENFGKYKEDLYQKLGVEKQNYAMGGLPTLINSGKKRA